MLSDVLLPAHVPGPSVIAGTRPVVNPVAPIAAMVFTRMRNAGFSSKNRMMTRSSFEWIASEWPSPPNSSSSMLRSQQASQPSATK